MYLYLHPHDIRQFIMVGSESLFDMPIDLLFLHFALSKWIILPTLSVCRICSKSESRATTAVPLCHQHRLHLPLSGYNDNKIIARMSRAKDIHPGSPKDLRPPRQALSSTPWASLTSSASSATAVVVVTMAALFSTLSLTGTAWCRHRLWCSWKVES
jgi:hypothetical protein